MRAQKDRKAPQRQQKPIAAHEGSRSSATCLAASEVEAELTCSALSWVENRALRQRLRAEKNTALDSPGNGAPSRPSRHCRIFKSYILRI